MTRKTWTQKTRLGYTRDKNKKGWRWRNKIPQGLLETISYKEVGTSDSGWLTLPQVLKFLNNLHENIHIDTKQVIDRWTAVNELSFRWINGQKMIHSENVDLVAQKFMENLVLDLSDDEIVTEEDKGEDSVGVQTVMVPEHPSQEDKMDMILRILMQHTSLLERIEAFLAILTPNKATQMELHFEQEGPAE